VVDNIQRLLEFFLSATNDFDTPDGAAAAYVGIGERMASLTRGPSFQPPAFLNSPLASFLNGGGGFGVGLGAASSNQDHSQRQQRAAVAADFAEFAPAMRKFGTQIAGRLTEKLASRLVSRERNGRHKASNKAYCVLEFKRRKHAPACDGGCGSLLAFQIGILLVDLFFCVSTFSGSIRSFRSVRCEQQQQQLKWRSNQRSRR
jgi:hypothetical protein